MKLFQNASIQRKQTLIIMLTTTVALLLACAAFTAYEVVKFRREMVSDLATLTDIVDHNTYAALDFNDPRNATETLAALAAQPNIVGACIFTPGGKVFATYDRSGADIIFKAPKAMVDGFFFGHGQLSLYKPIVENGETIGMIYIESDLRALHSRLAQYALIVAGVFLITMLAAFVLSARLQGYVSQPILHLVDTAREVVASSNYSLRALKRSEDELGVLTETFNQMLGQIQERDAALQKNHAELERRVVERTAELASSLSLINATLESTADGILVTNAQGEVSHCNERFLALWRIPRDLFGPEKNQQVWAMALEQLKGPQQFTDRVNAIIGLPEADSFDLIEFTDGRVIERHSKPQLIAHKYAGRVWSFRDITERRRAETMLRNTEELYRRCISGAGAVPYSCDYKSKSYAFIGEGIEKLIGYKREEVTPDLWQKIVKDYNMLGETAGLTKEEAKRQIAAGELQRWACDMRVVTRSGKVVWLSDASVQTLDELGNRTGSMGIIEDITERKHAEITSQAFSKLGQSLMTAATPVEAARSIVNVADELFGWDSCAFQLYFAEIEKTISVLAIDTVKGQRKEGIAGEMIQGEPSVIERRVIKQGAELILKEGPLTIEPGAVAFGDEGRPSASIMRVPVRTGNRVVAILNIQSYSRQAYTGKDLAMLQTLADYCGAALDRIQAEAQLAKERDLLRTLLDNSPDCIYFKDINSRFLRCSKSMSEMVGTTPENIVGTGDFDFLTEKNAREAFADEQAVIQSGDPIIGKIENFTMQNGRVIWMLTSKLPLRNPDNEIVGTFGISKDITAIKEAEAKLKRAHEELLAASRLAGMAEVATSVLHNVGNVLNSVNISSSLIAEKVRNSKVGNFAKAMALMNEHVENLPAFLAHDPKGQQLPAYLNKLATHLANEQIGIQEELGTLCDNVEHIKEIVAMQQSYAKVSGLVETHGVVDLVEDALRMNAGAMDRHQVKLVREFSPVPPIQVEKHKVLQILVNLIRNAKYAVDDNPEGSKQVTISVSPVHNDGVKISVIDNGVGIPAENLTRIFGHGFTTKKEGHGFGLHSAALAAKDLGGSLSVHSEGRGKGATFTVELPMNGKK